MNELLYEKEVYKIIGCAIKVHNELGPGFLEAVYHEALEIEFKNQSIAFISKPEINIYYNKIKLKKYYEPDFIINDKIVVEIKAIKNLTQIDEAQIFNSIRSSNKKLGLLINFGELSLKWKRFITEKYFNSHNSRLQNEKD